MKKILSLAALATTVILFSFKIAGNGLPIGSNMPEAGMKLKDISGKDITLKDAVKANGLLVMFSCNTCPYVIRNQQRTKEICEFAQKNKMGVILLNSNEANRSSSDSYEAMQKYAQAQGYTWYYAVDKNSVIADAFDAGRTPECFLFNKDAKLVYHGAIDDNPQDASAVTRQHLKEAITETADGKTVSVAETRSVGCGIKRAE